MIFDNCSAFKFSLLNYTLKVREEDSFTFRRDKKNVLYNSSQCCCSSASPGFQFLEPADGSVGGRGRT